jgi:extradiol dioxygenase family protein
MSNRFHLAIEAGDLKTAVDFYVNVLGCTRHNSEFKYPDAWVDINFWGNELTLHGSDPTQKKQGERHNVDMGNVTVPHFGVHLTQEAFDEVKRRCVEHNVTFIDEPYVRFKGELLEQETMFLADPHGNAMEIKTMKNPEELWKIQSKQN